MALAKQLQAKSGLNNFVAGQNTLAKKPTTTNALPRLGTTDAHSLAFVFA